MFSWQGVSRSGQRDDGAHQADDEQHQGGAERPLARELLVVTKFNTTEPDQQIGRRHQRTQEVDRLALRGHVKPPTDNELAIGKNAGMAQLRKCWGDQMDANLAIAQGEVARMAKANPHIVAMLESTGLGNSVWLTKTLVTVARAKGRVK